MPIITAECWPRALDRTGPRLRFPFAAHEGVGSLRPVPLPHKIATLLYGFNDADEVLLLERAKEPNRGLWSPPGGKLHTGDGESPWVCACREAREELGLELAPRDLHLTGIVSEHGYEGHAHWLMFVFEIRRRLNELPKPCDEGRFEFFAREALAELAVPKTDREQIWPLFWEHRGGFFAAHCRCHADGRDEWTLEETRVPHIFIAPASAIG